MADVTIWHNPRCSKSRETLALLRSNGVEPEVREYLKDPPSPEALIERPVVIRGDRAVLGRPPENVLELL